MSNWGEMLKISKSQLTTYLQCPRKYRFQYVEGRPWEFVPSALLFGRAIHEAVALFYEHFRDSGEKPGVEPLLERFHAGWRESATGQPVKFQGAAEEAELLPLGEGLLRLFHEEIRPRRVYAVEMPFTVDLVDPRNGRTADVKLIGYLDLVELDDDDTLIVVETKTAAKRYSDRDGDSRLNGFTYAYALRQMGSVAADDSLLFRYDVLVKTKKPALQQVFLTRDSRDDRRFLIQIHEVLRAIERRVFYPNFGWWCEGCPFRQACGDV